MRRILPGLFAGLVGTLLAAEIVLRLLPVSTATMTGYHFDPDLLTYPAHHRWRTSTGWDLRNSRELRSNNRGFLSAHDFVADPNAVALIGDSYVEASMLDEADRPAAQLEALLGGQRPVYALGSPGTALLDYAQRIRLAHERFGVRDVVLLLERYDARQSLCGSGNVHSRCLDRETLAPRIERLPAPDAFKRLSRHSALAQYLVSQLKLRPARLLDAIFSRSTPEAGRADRPSGPAGPRVDEAQLARVQRMAEAVVDAFYEAASPHLAGRLVILVDGRRDGPAARPELIDLERAHLIERLRQRGAIVHDMEPVYAGHAGVSRRSLDVGPYDGHLNRLGVALAMRAAAESLQR
ncbi:MAG: hypothetical protein HYZ20_03160 [Burkholderiales bacterium]|nr:hypothetical protein [Burkholderiales bacterium]